MRVLNGIAKLGAERHRLSRRRRIGHEPERDRVAQTAQACPGQRGNTRRVSKAGPVPTRRQIGLVDQDKLDRAKHERVFQRLVLAFGHGKDHDPDVLPDLELRRTDEIADILDDEQIDVLERETRKSMSDHIRVEVTLTAEARISVHLGNGNAEALEPVGIEGGLHVALEHTHAD